MLHHHPRPELPIVSPEIPPDGLYTDPAEAMADLKARYAAATGFLRDNFAAVMAGAEPAGHYRAFYPLVSLTTTSGSIGIKRQYTAP